MPRSIKQKRKEFMDHLTNIMDLLDPSGENSKWYHEYFDKMTDEQFDKYIRKFFNDDKQQLYLEIVEFERVPHIENIIKCSEYMKVPLWERVMIPYATTDDDTVYVTPEPVPVGYIHEKRMPQTLFKKSAGSIDIEERSANTGQVTGKDKNARNTDTETYSMIALGAEKGLKELMGARADDMKAKSQMYNEISKNGYVSLEDLDDDVYYKTSVNTLDVYFLMQGLTTNLTTDLKELSKPKNT